MTTFGIIGAGNVGAGLATALVRGGHAVTLTNSDPTGDKLAAAAQAAGATAGTLADALATDVVVLATPFGTAVEIATENAAALAGKVVVDVTNPLSDDYMNLTVGFDTSAAETIQAAAPEARVVKAFNTVFAATYTNEALTEAGVYVPVAGDEAEAKSVVLAAAKDAGFDAVDAGALSVARFLEPTVMNLIHLGFAQGHGPALGLQLVRG